MSADNKKRFYVLRVNTGHERKVMEALKTFIVEQNIEQHFGEVLLPIEEVVEVRGGQKKNIKRKHFPGYLFIEMAGDDHLFNEITQAHNKVIGFVKVGKEQRPRPISDVEAKRLVAQVTDDTATAKPKVVFATGEVVRVIDGPFADFNGVVEDVNYEKSRLRVAVLIFGRSTPVELEFSQVEKS